MDNQIGRVHAEEISLQHGRLDFLVEHAAGATSLEEAAKRCLEIARYFELHAYDEEQFMAEHGYPRLEQHRLEHVEIVRNIRSLLEEAGSELDSVRGALHRVGELMVAHRDTTDRHYFDFMKSQGLMPADAEP